MRSVKLFCSTLVVALVAGMGISLGTFQSAQATTPDTFFSTTVGIIPWGVALSPDGTKAYVANTGNSSVSEVNANTGNLIRTFPVGASPRALVVSADGREVFVVNYLGNSVTEIRLSDGATNTLLVDPRPTSIAISPDNTKAYVTNNGSETVSVINITSNPQTSWSSVASTVSVDGEPTAIAISPDGDTGYVTLDQSDELVSIDLTDPTFPILKRITVGSNPTAVVVSSDAQGAFVANDLDNTVSAVWLNESITNPSDPDFDMRIDGIVSVGSSPNSLAFSPINSHLYVANYLDGDVSVINTSTLDVEEIIDAGTRSGGVAASPDGSKIFVTAMTNITDFGSLEAINVASPMVMTLHVTSLSGPYILPIQDLWGTVAWGDGTFSSHYGQSDIPHIYSVEGTYLVTITGDATGYGSPIMGKKGKVTSVASWGDFASSPYFETLDLAFVLEPELTALPADFPSYVNSASYMFTGADMFNQDISSWDVSNLVNMSGMFYGAMAFNAPIGTWDISSATNVTNMFKEAYAFNQDLSDWHTNQLFYFDGMFEDAESFNQDLSTWSVQSLTSAINFLDGSAMSPLNYSKLLRAWSQQDVNRGVQLDAHNTMYYEPMDYFRDYLIEEEGWAIYDDGPTSIPPATIISAPTASSIQVGQQTLASALSGGSASQPGTFSFTHPTAVLSSGSHSVSVTFTPDDPLLFGPFTTYVNINVSTATVPSSPAEESKSSEAAALTLTKSIPSVSLGTSTLKTSEQSSPQSENQAAETSLSSPSHSGETVDQPPMLWLFGGAGLTILVAAVIFYRVRTRAKLF